MPRTKKQPDKKLLLQVAKLKCEKGLTNQAIAAHNGIDPRQVRFLLRESMKWLLAEQQRLTRLERPDKEQRLLEEQLIKKFPFLKQVIIVPGKEIRTDHEYAALREEWAAIGSAWLDKLGDEAAREGRALHVAMSGGEKILKVMNSLPERTRSNMFFYASAAIGRPVIPHKFHVDPSVNATVAWVRSGQIPHRCFYTTVSPYDLSDGAKSTYEDKRDEIVNQLETMSESPFTRKYFEEEMTHIDVAFAGVSFVGPPKWSPGILRRLTAAELIKITTNIDATDIAAEGAFGDIAYCFFDANGNGNNEKWRFFLTAGDHDPKTRGVNFYKKMVEDNKRVVVIEGSYKVPIVLAALRGKLFNVWITDEAAARRVLAEG